MINKYLNAYKAIKNNSALPGSSNLSVEVLASLERNTTPIEVKEKIKSGEIKTRREMQELRKKLNAERKEKERPELVYICNEKGLDLPIYYNRAGLF